MSISHNHSVALYLATEHGFPVFPVREKAYEYIDRKTGKTRTLHAKSPYTAHGPKEATTDTAQINEWWTKHPDALVGVECGERSNILAVDIDTGGNKCGEASFAATGLTIPKTVQTRTMSGGRHIFFKYPTGWNIRNSASTCFGQDVDVRGEGGYVIFAGSVLPDGRRYEPIEGLSVEEVEIAPLPNGTLNGFWHLKKRTGAKRSLGRRKALETIPYFATQCARSMVACQTKTS